MISFMSDKFSSCVYVRDFWTIILCFFFYFIPIIPKMYCLSYWGCLHLVLSLIFVYRCVLEWYLHGILYDPVYCGLNTKWTLRLTQWRSASKLQQFSEVDISHSLPSTRNISPKAFLLHCCLPGGHQARGFPPLHPSSGIFLPHCRWRRNGASGTLTFEIRSKINSAPLCVCVCQTLVHTHEKLFKWTIKFNFLVKFWSLHF